ncbi:TPA: MptD family putative ECF transporter S component, partial [Streptococcus pyogenes]|nr:MptD family putative ECF transporter S component [Streptococcus pyogenes]
IIGGIPFMLFLTKVKKPGMILIMSLIMGIMMFILLMLGYTLAITVCFMQATQSVMPT